MVSVNGKKLATIIVAVLGIALTGSVAPAEMMKVVHTYYNYLSILSFSNMYLSMDSE